MQKLHFESPAFPPQVAQDNLGRLVAPIPGVSKLEYFSLHLLPFYLDLATKKRLADKGEPITPIEAAISTAKELLDKLNEKQDETTTLQIVD